MSNTSLIIEERSRDIGNFFVGRLLPFVEKRAVGPFVFIDHMGPSIIGENGKYIDVDQHPHIGLCTLTYLFEGEMEHRDSTGAEMIIQPGSVNLMVAGRGVTHTERTPQNLRNGKPHKMHGYQIWIALPKEFEEIEPSFHHIPKDELPSWNENGIEFKLVTGEIKVNETTYKSPTPTFSKSFMIDVFSEAENKLNLSGKLFGEIGIVVVKGAIIENKGLENEHTIEQGQMMIAKMRDFCELGIEASTQLLIFGGEPLEKRYMYWNFVSSSMERIEIAKKDWADRKFPKVPNDDTYIHLPN